MALTHIAESDLQQRDLKHIWHPCSQMKDYEKFKLIEIVGAKGSYLELKNGQKIIDAISSWWCKSLGHNHPRLKQALIQQVEQFEHVILANTTNQTIVELSEKLAELCPPLTKVLYASDGSSAVEMAMKMSLHAQHLQGKSQKNFFIALENSYHGETCGALSVSDNGIYTDPYRKILFEAFFISPLPYVSGIHDPLWQDCSIYWEKIVNKLAPLSHKTCAIIIEPILQGAGGMKIMSQDFLKRLRIWSEEHGIYLIADEIMTGFGRTGKMLACDHAEIKPDFLCLGKGLTSGWLPLSVMLTKDNIYDLFYDDYATGKSFLHSHTHSGNALAARVALEVLTIFHEQNIVEKAELLGIHMHQAMLEVADQTKRLTNIRQIGAMVAADLICDPAERIGFEIYQHAVKLGALLRPIGNTLYWLPPLNMEIATLIDLKNITSTAISAFFSKG